MHIQDVDLFYSLNFNLYYNSKVLAVKISSRLANFCHYILTNLIKIFVRTEKWRFLPLIRVRSQYGYFSYMLYVFKSKQLTNKF